MGPTAQADPVNVIDRALIRHGTAGTTCTRIERVTDLGSNPGTC
jgi:hypothetical protein